MKNPTVFAGHKVHAMIINVSLALAPVILLFNVALAKADDNKLLVILITMFLIFIYPHPAYLFFEIKHLLCKNYIASEINPHSILIFGFQSILGFALQVQAIVLTYKIYNLQQYGLVSIVGLSALASFGGCLGLTNLIWLQGLYPPKLIKHIGIVLGNKKLMLTFIATTIMLTVTAYIFC